MKPIEEILTLQDIQEFPGKFYAEKLKAFSSVVEKLINVHGFKKLTCSSDICSTLATTGLLNFEVEPSEEKGNMFAGMIGNTDVYVDINSKGLVFE